HTRFSRDWSSDVCSSDLFVAVVPVALRFQNVFERDTLAGRHELAQASAGAFLGRGRQEDLTFGIREDDRPLVPPLRHDVFAPSRSEERRAGKKGIDQWRG